MIFPQWQGRAKKGRGMTTVTPEISFERFPEKHLRGFYERSNSQQTRRAYKRVVRYDHQRENLEFNAVNFLNYEEHAQKTRVDEPEGGG